MKQQFTINLPAEIPAETAGKVRQMFLFYAKTHDVKEHDLVNFTDLARVLSIIDKCNAEIGKDGLVVHDRFGFPRKNPAVDIMKDYLNQKVAIMREYGLTERSCAQITKLSRGMQKDEEQTEFEKSLDELLETGSWQCQ